MMRSRIQRELEKDNSVLYKSTAQAASAAYDAKSSHVTPKTSYKTSGKVAKEEGGLTAAMAGGQMNSAQMQLFAEENDSMMKMYEDKLDKVK